MTEQLIDKHTKIQIKSHVLEIRPLISKDKRVILLNVCPVIPHFVIEEKLAELKIKPASHIIFIRAESMIQDIYIF